MEFAVHPASPRTAPRFRLAAAGALTLLLLAPLPGRAQETAAAGVHAVLDHAVAALGGPEVLDGLTSLLVDSATTRPLPGAGDTQVEQRTLWDIDGQRLRRDARLNGIEVSSVVTPDTGFLLSMLGPMPLPEEDRAAMLDSQTRSPLALLRWRDRPGFLASLDGSGELDGRAVDHVVVSWEGRSQRLAVDRETGDVLELAFAAVELDPGVLSAASTPAAPATSTPPASAEEGATGTGDAAAAPAADIADPAPAPPPSGDVVIRYAEFREVDRGLRYPFRIQVVSGPGAPSTRTVHAVRLDVPLDDALFAPPAASETEPETP